MKRQATYYPTLDGWRAISFTLVFLSHAKFLFLAPQGWRFWGQTNQLGVEIFFGISGFLITSLLLEEIEWRGKLSLRAFYVRRASRLLPAQFLYLATVLVLWRLQTIDTSWTELAVSPLFARNAFIGDWVTRHFWSLSVEEHFYFLWPVTMALCVRTQRMLWTALGIVAALLAWHWIDIRFSVVQVASSAQRWHFSDIRMFPLFAGALAALALRDVRTRLWAERIPVGTIPSLTAFGLLLLWVHYSLPGRLLLMPVLIVVALLATIRAPQGAFARMLESPTMRWIGRRSYGLYLWQQLLLIPLGDRTWLPFQGMAAVLFALVMLPILAELSYRFLERPVLQWGHGWSQRILGPEKREERPAELPRRANG